MSGKRERRAAGRARRPRLLRLADVLLLYRERLRTQLVPELLAGAGVAIGVALLFAVQVAHTSVSSSAREVIRGVAGAAQLQVAARDGRGLPEALVERARRVDGVVRAAPLLEQRAVLVGPGGERAAVRLASAAPSLAALSGALASSVPIAALGRPGVMLPAAVNDALGLPSRARQALLRPQPAVTVLLRGRRHVAPVTSVLGSETIGPLAQAHVAVAPLDYLQRIAGLDGRVSRVLVEAAPGREAEVRARLRALAGPALAVASSDADAELLAAALAPNDQASLFFAAISALVALLLAFNAMLLTAPERRRLVAELRRQRFRRSQVAQVVLVHALLLGAAATAAGLLVGGVLARTVLRSEPDYLASVFPLGGGAVVGVVPLATAVACGLGVTVLAALPLLAGLRARPVDGHEADDGQSLSHTTRVRLFVAALALLAVTNGLLLVTPDAAAIAGAGLAVACLLLVPAAFAAAVRAVGWLADRMPRWAPVSAAVLELRATAVRALALAAVGAVAVFGALALEGGHRDLLRGLYDGYGEYVSTADVWVVNHVDDLATKDIDRPGLVGAVARVDGVAGARPVYSSFLDVAGRRVWALGRDARGDGPLIPPSQVEDGDPAAAEAQLRRGGAVALSAQLADALGARVGDAVELPTPTGPLALTVAATTTNLGWTSGAVVLNARDYRRAWGGPRPSAVEVDVAPGAEAAAVSASVGRALGPDGGLLVQTAGVRAEQANALARQGLRRLTEISLLLVVAASLAMAAAIGNSIWQRRPRLAGMRLHGFTPRQLWRILLIETALVLAIGCTIGAAAGVYGQWLTDQWLRRTTGFPAAFALNAETLLVVALVLLIALAIVAVPGRRAARAPRRLALDEPA